MRHLDRMRAPLIVAYGTYETPEFQRQNREFVAAIEATGKKVRLLMDEYYNHFELPEQMGTRARDVVFSAHAGREGQNCQDA